MARIYLEKDADQDLIRERPISVIGYGNQGRSQALNLRDSGLDVTIGNVDDEYATAAREDGLTVCPVREAAEGGEIIMLLLPDEIAPEIYERDIHGVLAEGNVLCLASGYNIMYGYISPPGFVDLVMVAPRMGGSDVRARYLNRQGFPSLVGAGQDHFGKGLEIAIAIAMGIGSTQGALASTFEEETIVDLFGEQLQGMGLHTAQLAFETMLEAGCSPEASLMELYMSEELADDWRNCAHKGLWKQLRGHSTTSQYGQLTRGPRAAGEHTREMFAKVMDDIRSGRFAREWTREQQSGRAEFKKLVERSLAHPINEAEERVRGILDASEQQP